ncbi:MAG: S49 family peptidase [Candidatus Bathyarchaeia archaeon]
MKSLLVEGNEQKKSWFEAVKLGLGRREILVTVLICVVIASSLIYSQYGRDVGGFGVRRGMVGIIKVEGSVVSSGTADWYSSIINNAMLNESIKAVVLVIDSPGGYADYIEQIYLDLLELKKKKPLVASVVSALSGGYYIAVAADSIYVHPTSFLGNIGVIGTGPPILIPSESVLETGAYKATGFSTLLFYQNLSHALDNFVSAVENGRVNASNPLRLSSTQLKRAMIYMGSEALSVGLADYSGSLQTAIQSVAREARLTEYDVAELRPRVLSTYASMLDSSNFTSAEPRNVTLEILDKLHPPPAMHYIYLPPKDLTQSPSSPELFSEAGGVFAGRSNVIVDIAHENQISWWTLDILIAELAKRNVGVSFFSQWEDIDSGFGNASVLIVASPTEVFTGQEGNRIEEFVLRGGMVVMLFDPAWEHIGSQGLSQGIIAPINSLSVRFGLSFAKGYLYNEEENFGLYRNIYVKDFKDSPLTQNLESLVLFTATHIHSMNRGVAWTSQDTYSSVAEKADKYAPIVWLKMKGNGTIIALGDLTFLREPFCYVEDNYRLIQNLASVIAGVEVPVEEDEDRVEEEVAKPDLPVGTEMNYTEWEDGEERLVRWFKVSETEVRIERPNRTSYYYFTEDGALRKWMSDGMDCVYEDPLPDPPYPLTKGKSWEYESDYNFTIDGEVNLGKLVAEEQVEGFEDVEAENGERYFCARVRFILQEELTMAGSNMTLVTTGRYWVSSDAGTVKQEETTQYYAEGLLYREVTRTLLLSNIKK